MASKVYAGRTDYKFGEHKPFHYIAEAEATCIEVDGIPMVRTGDILFPARDYVATKTEAKQQIVDQLVRYAGVLQAEIDRLKDEILHETLTQESAA